MKKLLLLVLLFATLATGCGNLSHIRQHTPAVEAFCFDSLRILSASQWKAYARENGINLRTGESRNLATVLGHYPEYVELAAKLKMESMQIPMDRWNAMTPEEQWRTTTGFFDRKMESNHCFRLATPVERARPKSFYVRELNYLLGKGYKLSPDGLWLVR